MLIWRGNGLAVPILAFGPLLAMDYITSRQSGTGYYASHVWPKLLGFTIAAVAVFFLARATENSGREGDHFFFIPIKFWTYILLVGGAVLSIVLTGEAPAAQPPVKETPPAAATPAPEAAPTNPSSASYAPPAQLPAPAVTTVAAQPPPEPVHQFTQVYADTNSKTYFPEPCRARPSNAVRLAKSAALLQGYILSPKCTE